MRNSQVVNFALGRRNNAGPGKRRSGTLVRTVFRLLAVTHLRKKEVTSGVQIALPAGRQMSSHRRLHIQHSWLGSDRPHIPKHFVLKTLQ